MMVSAPNPPSLSTIFVLGPPASGTPDLAESLAGLLPGITKRPKRNKTSRPDDFFRGSKPGALNQKILRSAGAKTNSWRPLDPDWFEGTAARKLRGQAKSLISENPLPSRPIGLEDPDIARLLPFWCATLHENGTRFAAVHIHRHPADTARELHETKGLSMPLAALQWLTFSLETEAATRGSKRAFVSFDDLCDGLTGSSVAKIETSLRIKLEPVAGTQTKRKRRRRKADLKEQSGLPGQLRLVHAVFDRWACTGEDKSDYPILDQVRHSVHAITAGTDHGEEILVHALGQPGDKALTSVQINKLRKPALVELIQALLRANAALSRPAPKPALAADEGNSQTERRDLELALLSRLLREAEEAPENLRSQLADREMELTKQSRKLQETQANLHKLKGQLADATKNITALSQENKNLSLDRTKLLELLQNSDSAREALLNSRIWRATAPFRGVFNRLRRSHGD